MFALNVAANCLTRRKIDLNIIAIFLFKISNTNFTLFIETPTRVYCPVEYIRVILHEEVC